MYNERFLAQTKPYGSRKGANHLRRSACMCFIVLVGMSMKAVLLHLCGVTKTQSSETAATNSEKPVPRSNVGRPNSAVAASWVNTLAPPPLSLMCMHWRMCAPRCYIEGLLGARGGCQTGRGPPSSAFDGGLGCGAIGGGCSRLAPRRVPESVGRGHSTEAVSRVLKLSSASWPCIVEQEQVGVQRAKEAETALSQLCLR